MSQVDYELAYYFSTSNWGHYQPPYVRTYIRTKPRCGVGQGDEREWFREWVTFMEHILKICYGRLFRSKVDELLYNYLCLNVFY